MSLLSMAGGATGTGTVTLLAPITNTDRTLTLPDVTDTMAGIAATQTLTNKTLTSPTLTTPNINSAQFATVSGTAPIYPCRAWVNFDGTGTVAIRASGNVSSITDSSVGNYIVNFITAMPDTNYVIFKWDNNFGAGWYDGNPSSTASVPIKVTNFSATAQDASSVSVSIFR